MPRGASPARGAFLNRSPSGVWRAVTHAAVAEIIEPQVIPRMIPDDATTISDDADELGSVFSSAVGDTVASSSAADIDEDPIATAARRQERVAPTPQMHGDPTRSRGASSRWNKEPEVGNFGLHFGNWGCRGRQTDAVSKRRQKTHDDQIMKSPAQVIVLCEATEYVADMLREPAVAGVEGSQGLEGRNTFECFVVKGKEQADTSVLIAARKDNCDCLEYLDYEVFNDHNYIKDGKNTQTRAIEDADVQGGFQTERWPPGDRYRRLWRAWEQPNHAMPMYTEIGGLL